MNGKTGGQVTFPTVGCVSVRSSTGNCDTASLIWGFGWLVVVFFFQHVVPTRSPCLPCQTGRRDVDFFFSCGG